MVSRKGDNIARQLARNLDVASTLFAASFKVPALEFSQREAQTAWDEIHQRLDEYNQRAGREGPHRA